MHVCNLCTRTILPIALGIITLSTATPGSGVASDGFRIMTDDEISQHRQTMDMLSGDERENYRNSRYRELRQRAAANGYYLPVHPPWHPEASPDTGMYGDAAAQARHEELRNRLDTHRASLQASLTDTRQEESTAGESEPPSAQPDTVSETTPESTNAGMTLAAPASGTQPKPGSEASQPQDAASPEAAVSTKDTPKPETLAASETTTLRDSETAATEEPVRATAPETARPERIVNARDMQAYRQQMRRQFDAYLGQRQPVPVSSWPSRAPSVPTYPYAPTHGAPPRQPMAPPVYPAPYWPAQR